MCFLFAQKNDQVDVLVLDEVRFSCIFINLLGFTQKVYKRGTVKKFSCREWSGLQIFKVIIKPLQY